jgi:hypothetical protein
MKYLFLELKTQKVEGCTLYRRIRPTQTGRSFHQKWSDGWSDDCTRL